MTNLISLFRFGFNITKLDTLNIDVENRDNNYLRIQLKCLYIQLLE